MSQEELVSRLQQAIPGGAHTYSRGRDQFPSNAPALLVRGQGAYVGDADGTRYLDYGMGLRSVTLGYAREEVDDGVRRIIGLGTNLTMSTMLELDAAEALIELYEAIDMVKFAKHGSNVTTGAVKLARAVTGRSLVAVTRQHPFHSFDDWFIGSTVMNRGIPAEVRSATLHYDYGDAASLERVLVENEGMVAAVVLEPAVLASPCPTACAPWPANGPVCGGCPLHSGNFLVEVCRLCDEHGALMILDEIITGFRWHLKGAQHQFGVKPDLTTVGKGMANGYALAALGGKREFMDVGSIHREGAERLFLMSTTHGPEMVGLAAFLATLGVYGERDVCSHLWSFGSSLRQEWQVLAKRHGVESAITLEGPDIGLAFMARDAAGQLSGNYRALFAQEMVRRGVLMPWLAPSLAHGEAELELTAHALDGAFSVYARALEDGYEPYLEGPPIKPVFRKLN